MLLNRALIRCPLWTLCPTPMEARTSQRIWATACGRAVFTRREMGDNRCEQHYTEVQVSLGRLTTIRRRQLGHAVLFIVAPSTMCSRVSGNTKPNSPVRPGVLFLILTRILSTLTKKTTEACLAYGIGVIGTIGDL